LLSQRWIIEDNIEFKGGLMVGYLVCYSCGGYYELRQGEAPNHYKHCCCGGKLKFCSEIEISNSKNQHKVGVWYKKIKPKGYKERPGDLLKEKIRLSLITDLLFDSELKK